MKRANVKMYWHNGRAYPSVNVKVYSFPRADEIAKRMNCDERLARQAGQFAWDSTCVSFWQDIKETAKEILGGDVRVYRAGRSDGHLIVDKMPDLESWNAAMLAKWRHFVNAVAEDIRCRTSMDAICEDIEENKWNLEGAEQYNFIDGEDGKPVCIAELKAKARAAGFGAVIRT